MKKEMSFSPKKLILHYKMDLAKHILSQNRYSIEETAFYCGFSGVTHFSRKFKQEFGISPLAYRKNGLMIVFNPHDWEIPLNDECFNKLIQLKDENKWFAKLLITIIDNLDNEAFSIEMLSDKLFMSSSNLNRKVKSLFEFSPVRLLRDIRLQYATELIVLQNKSITEAAFLAGFFDVAHLSRVFKKNFNCSPSKYESRTTLFPFINLLKKEYESN
ncbi:AraC family transcriptional regulator [Flavobacterium sp. LPB0248]|uniref:helix-turn-helix transcriptional regulator n=1 Tax=Flavobacterium sp. LPB0248 TaxID=2614441 RepID=UPI0015A54DC0|nr:AraC family transcriptional regulator [Flavobacterium sp. LPB0248]QLC67379.1 AraC family transcriptional regulator [Flavobacterium sp. LPB0248]